MSKTKTQLHTQYGCLGDQICFLGAARNYAKAHPEVDVVIANLPELVAAYEDCLVSTGAADNRIDCNPEHRHRAQGTSPDVNYLGTYMSELGLAVIPPPRMELPPLPRLPDLVPTAYVCIQPYSGFARNPSLQFLQALVDACRHVLPDWPVVVVGSPDTKRELSGVDYNHMGGPAGLVTCIQNAGLVLTPRSASAQVAAACGVPSIVWVTGDGEDWHLNYPSWPHLRIQVDTEIGKAAETAREYLARVKAGGVSRPGPLELALRCSGVSTDVALWFGEGVSTPAGFTPVSPNGGVASKIRETLRVLSGSDPGEYPSYLNLGNAAQYVTEDAKRICTGRGLDIGADQWPLPDAIPIRDEPHQNAYRLDAIEDSSVDFVFSSHCLEHLHRPADALALWARKLRPGGTLFLYLPHPQMKFWHPQGPWGGDHKWTPSPDDISAMVEQVGLKVRVCTTEPDAYWSFRCIATKSKDAPASRTPPAIGHSTVRLGAAIPCLNEWRFMPAVVGQVLTVVDRVVIMRGNRTQSGAPVKLSDEIPQFDPRVEIIEGNWETEAQTRNAGMEHLSDCDYILMIDSDEILLERDLEQLRDLAASRRHAVLSVRLFTYWKTPDWRIDPPEHGTIKLVLRRDVRIHGVREIQMPVFDTGIWCRHLSYVRTDEEVREKLRISGHAH